MSAPAVLLLTSALLLVTCFGDLMETSPTVSPPGVTSAGPVSEPAAPAAPAGAAPAGAAPAAAGAAAAAGSVVEGTEDSETDTAGDGPTATVSCQDELHCHCALGNGTVAVQCRYGHQNVRLRWNVLASRPSADTRFEIDLQTRGAVTVLPSFLELKLRPPADGRPSVMFIIRDATLVEALYASEETFSTEWHLDRVTLPSLNVKQLCPPPHRLLLTVRDSRVGLLRLPPLPPGTRLTLDSCRVGEVTGIPAPLAPAPPPPETATDRPELIVRKCTLDTLRTAAISIDDVPGQSPPSLLFTGNVIGEMERAAITVRSPSCQLTFARNEVYLLQREVFSVTDGTLRLSNNTLHMPHTAALRGFCGQISLIHNDVRVPPAFGALHFDACVRYSMLGNTFRCPCDGVDWLAVFERRQRPSEVEVFYERLLKSSFCSAPGGRVPMTEFALLEDCSGAGLRSTLVTTTATLAAAVLVLLLVLALCWCWCRRRGSTKLHPPRLRRPKNLYSSDISAPISKPAAAAAAGRPVTAPSSASLSALSGVDARQLGHYVTLESEEDDALYATIVYKKRRAPVPPPGSTPGPRRAAPPAGLNRCVSEGGIRLPVYGSLQHLPARKLSGAGAELRAVDGPPQCIAEEAAENPYLVPDGTASVYMEVPPPQLYEEIMPVEEEEEGIRDRSGWAAPQRGKTSKDSGIGDDFCLEEMRQEGPAGGLGEDVYSPAVRPRRP